MSEKVFQVGDRVRVMSIGLYCENYEGAVYLVIGPHCGPTGRRTYVVRFDEPHLEAEYDYFAPEALQPLSQTAPPSAQVTDEMRWFNDLAREENFCSNPRCYTVRCSCPHREGENMKKEEVGIIGAPVLSVLFFIVGEFVYGEYTCSTNGEIWDKWLETNIIHKGSTNFDQIRADCESVTQSLEEQLTEWRVTKLENPFEDNWGVVLYDFKRASYSTARFKSGVKLAAEQVAETLNNVERKPIRYASNFERIFPHPPFLGNLQLDEYDRAYHRGLEDAVGEMNQASNGAEIWKWTVTRI